MRWRKTYGTVYSRDIETLIVKLTTTDGMVGWGEAQAPIAPEVVQEIIHVLIAPIVLAQGTTSPVSRAADALRRHARSRPFWRLLYRRHQRNRYRPLGFAGESGGKALASVSLAARQKPLCRCMFPASPAPTSKNSWNRSSDYLEQGAHAFKIFMAQEPSECLSLVREIRRRSPVKLFVDALWRFELKSALRFARELEAYDVGWLEAPLPPEDVAAHQALAQSSPIPIAIGESYRTRFEVMPFLEARAMHVLQPDIGRCGVTEGNHLASLAAEFPRQHGAPHQHWARTADRRRHPLRRFLEQPRLRGVQPAGVCHRGTFSERGTRFFREPAYRFRRSQVWASK